MRWPWQTLERDDLSPGGITPAIEAFWASLQGTGFSPRLASRVWAAERCLQLNCQQVAEMPLRFIGTTEPAWVSNPDPVWFPNGIGDAIFAATYSMYSSGDAFLLITARYANGLPSAWTVLKPNLVNVQQIGGRRVYKYAEQPLDSRDVVQITRNPTGRLRGTSALRSYAAHLQGSLAASELGSVMMGEGAVPNAVIKSIKKLTAEQAAEIQTQWVDRTAVRRGAPAVLGPDLDFKELAFSPADLLLLDAQEFNARVIASAFGVPAFMLNMPLTGGLTYQNPEILFDFWWRAELKPAAGRISDALTAQMLPRGNSVSFDPSEALAPSLPEQHKMWLEAFTAGLVTADEYRLAVLGLPALGMETAANELLAPPVADASPADAPVFPLRPAVGPVQISTTL